MRQYEINPSAAILALADMLRRDIEGSVTAALRKEIADLGRLLDGIKGAPGKDAKAEEVARVILSSAGFRESLRGEPGISVSAADVVRAMRADRVLMESLRGPAGDPASPDRIAELLMGNERFLAAVTPEAPEAAAPEAVARELASDKGFVRSTRGEDGSPDKPEEVAAKLNETRESVNQSVVIGLKDFVSRVQRFMQEGRGGGKGQAGGGMGTTVHKSFDVSSATTTVVLDSKIAAGGYAIMGAYYEGGFLVRGVGYTVGADRKTLTLLFTPEDGTHVDVVYIRS